MQGENIPQSDQTGNGEVVNFGLHLTLDGYGGNPEKLNDKDLVFKCLDELPEKVNMHKIYGPHVMWSDGGNPKDSGGYSGFVMIAESHISCHTFPFRKFVSIDVYTCGDHMDKDFVVQYFKDIFELEDVELNFIKRGTQFPSKDLLLKN